MRRIVIFAITGIFVCIAQCVLGNTPVCFEAESAGAVEAPMIIVQKEEKATDVSGKGYIEVLRTNTQSQANLQSNRVTNVQTNASKKTKGHAVYNFEVAEDGEYSLWCRVWWLDRCGNSLTVIIDDGKPFTFGQDGTYKFWHWVKNPPKIKQLNLKKGKHKLQVKRREDGIKLDQILFTKDKRFVPMGIEKITAQRPKKN